MLGEGVAGKDAAGVLIHVGRAAGDAFSPAGVGVYGGFAGRRHSVRGGSSAVPAPGGGIGSAYLTVTRRVPLSSREQAPACLIALSRVA